MQKRAMPIGMDDFKKIREGYYLVDKTDFIRQFLDDHSEVTLITRPRRFGKTLFMSMLDWFFACDKKTQSEHLFDDLAISRAGTAYMAQRGSRPVIYLSLKGIGADSWNDALAVLRRVLQLTLDRFRYLLEEATPEKSDLELFRLLLDGKADTADMQVSLKYLTQLLAKVHGVKPILLLDEYDAPLQNAWDGGYYEEAVNFFRSFYNFAFKNNEYLDFAVLTGVLRVAKESIFSGLNNLRVCTVTSDQYSEACGFTPAEVRQLAMDFCIEEKLPELQEWYDGYHFCRAEIYNPWSVICYVAEGCRPQPYWMNTSSNGILKQLLRRVDARRIRDMQGLLTGQPVRAQLREGTIYDGIGQNDSDLYNMLLTTGYLTPEAGADPLRGNLLRMVIPNKEIQRVYADEILAGLTPHAGSDLYHMMLDDMLRGNGTAFAEELQEIVAELASTFDTASNKQEAFYHGLMLGLTALLHGNGYQIKSNGESGKGRFDVGIFPLCADNPGVLLEFKTVQRPDDLSAAAAVAGEQILRQEYLTEFKSRNVQTVWQYGIAFCGKNMALQRLS